MTETLRKDGRIQPATATCLNAIRDRRNKWLHSGIEPSEADAVEAMDLAANLLSSVVPVRLRPTSTIIIL